jgi:hypothetical protein
MAFRSGRPRRDSVTRTARRGNSCMRFASRWRREVRPPFLFRNAGSTDGGNDC